MCNIFSKLFVLFFIGVIGLLLSGCTVIFQKGRRVDVKKISKLKTELSDLGQANLDLEQAKTELQNRFRQEVGNNEVQIEMLEKGLVITFVSEVLYGSGKADLRKESFKKLAKVAHVLNTTVKGLSVGIEGHTDNAPIKHSGWKSNWQLSLARALSVLEYFEQKQNVDPTRLSATGFGEYHPVVSNDTKEGQQKNRRVEIVILPKIIVKGR